MTNRHYFPLIFFIFALPLFASVLVYSFSDGIELQRKNNGILLEAPISLNSLNLSDRGGKSFLQDATAGRWSLVYLSGSPCLEQCESNLTALERVRLALGKDYRRTGLLLLEPPGQQSETGSESLQIATEVAVIDHNNQIKLAADFGAMDNYSGPLLYLADDRGNLIMSYKGKVDQQAVYEDLRWLLKVNKRAY